MRDKLCLNGLNMHSVESSKLEVADSKRRKESAAIKTWFRWAVNNNKAQT